MYENQLTGSLPISLSNASKLQYIEADANNFSGKFSVNFGGLHRLEELLISSNNLGSGDDDEMNFLQSLVNCSSLRRIDLAENQFKVYKGILGEDRSIVAIKVLNIQRQGASRSFISECEVLKNIHHRNLLKIISCCSSVDFRGNDFKALVYEFLPNGSLENWLHMDLEINNE
ncbi:probable LRR receptor-like serine/threonine-protein kinase At3g47570 [Quercus robur]|uniref:probable LRR receptor-like serine/threonine-protein kinase At3g47570 n=1 Tax=Quercus robur TaxID=38942 RepID=UPI0021620F01|nr:probable LRR receptor-like serine/threonine-protein kinase At3g47570 [Quercus robur]